MKTQMLAPLTKCPASLTEDQVAQFHADGYLVFEDLLSQEEVAEVRQAMYEFVGELVRQGKCGEATVTPGNWQKMRNYSGMNITNNEKHYGVLLEPGVEVDIKNTTAEEVDRCFRKLFNYADYHPVFQRALKNPMMRGVIESLIGTDPIVYGNMALSKPARIGVAKPWHQDMAYFDYLPLHGGAHVWIAIDDATIENGCMVVLPGGHKLGPKVHVHEDDCTIEKGRVDYATEVPLEMKAGSVLFFSPMLPHETRVNTSEHRRRSLQFFFRGKHTRLVDKNDYDEYFVDENGDAGTCHAAGIREKQG